MATAAPSTTAALDHRPASCPAGPPWWSEYRREWLRADAIAGLTAAAVVIPKGMALAAIAGLQVQIGLATCLVPMLVYALCGSSRVLSVSSTTTLAILLSAELVPLDAARDAAALLQAAATVALLVGALLLLAGWLRLGFVASFLSESVLVGFKTGIGLVILVDQLPKLFGLAIEKQGFFRDLGSLLHRLPHTSGFTLLVSVVLLLVMLLTPRVAPRIPAALLVVLVAVAGSALLSLADHGVDTVGPVPSGLPALQLPGTGLLVRLWPGALGIALMSFTESIASARAFQGSADPRPQPDRELLALGLANLAGGLTGCLPAGGGTSQTAVNCRAGARTPLASLVTAAVALAVMLLLAPVLSLLPQAALAVVVVVYAFDLIRPAEFLTIRRVRHPEFRWAVIALAGVVLLGTLKGILVAVVVSLLSLAQQEMHPPVYVLARQAETGAYRPADAHPEDQTWPGLLVVRVEGRLFFANAQGVAERIRSLIETHQPGVLALDGRAIIDLEYSALKMLTEAHERLEREGIRLWLAGLNPGVKAMVRRSELGRRLGDEGMPPSLTVAVERFKVAEAVSRAGPAPP
jgi:high affinity sulfate transporter 1